MQLGMRSASSFVSSMVKDSLSIVDTVECHPLRDMVTLLHCAERGADTDMVGILLLDGRGAWLAALTQRVADLTLLGGATIVAAAGRMIP